MVCPSLKWVMGSGRCVAADHDLHTGTLGGTGGSAGFDGPLRTADQNRLGIKFEVWHCFVSSRQGSGVVRSANSFFGRL
jgi:hypothetical protein